jgi:arylsulfatase A-like enzyme
MKRRDFLKTIASVAASGMMFSNRTLEIKSTILPNFVIIFIDDMGYGDIEPFGSTSNSTPHLSRMADEGVKFTSFYVGWTACSPSRASLMTGCYAKRVGYDGKVNFPGEPRGLNPSEITIADLLKGQGYKTGCFGKWHLGDQPEFMPNKQGFDYYFGTPYSNDMWPLGKASRNYPPLPIMRNEKIAGIVEDGDDQAMLCKYFTDEAVNFIHRNKDKPFFVYLPHAFVHNPRFAREEFMENAGGDVDKAHVEECDWSVGQILNTLRELDLADNTLVIFTSDNGPSGGMTAAPLRGKKGGPVYEGHMREPTVAWWPGKIPAGSVCDGIATTMDLLPTFAKLAGTEAPTDRVIDGKDISKLFFKPGSKSPHDRVFYKETGVRLGKWKLLIGDSKDWELYDLETDLSEQNNVIADHPEVVSQLQGLLTAHLAEIEANFRPPAFAENPKPIVPHP